jgi:hypothetical protein
VIAVKDDNGCSQSQGITITEPDNVLEIILASVLDVNCKGENTGQARFNYTGGTGIPEFSINGTTFQANSEFNNLLAGNYIAYVQDENTCLDTLHFSISEPQNFLSIASLNQTDVACYGEESGSLQITASGGTPGYMYSIDSGMNFKSAGSFNQLRAGTYYVVVKDNLNCMYTQSTQVNEPLNPWTFQSYPKAIQTVQMTKVVPSNFQQVEEHRPIHIVWMASIISQAEYSTT